MIVFQWRVYIEFGRVKGCNDPDTDAGKSSSLITIDQCDRPVLQCGGYMAEDCVTSHVDCIIHNAHRDNVLSLTEPLSIPHHRKYPPK